MIIISLCNREDTAEKFYLLEPIAYILLVFLPSLLDGKEVKVSVSILDFLVVLSSKLLVDACQSSSVHLFVCVCPSSLEITNPKLPALCVRSQLSKRELEGVWGLGFGVWGLGFG